ncbi:nitrous oxide-stimulated promoter family protein [Sulfurimonas sp.]|uniref:nitrous oxide-stimulated promoter family protein n=1 Tax=Sulfurimonas sp. TaxID=2022749 RepID=UPI00356946A9
MTTQKFEEDVEVLKSFFPIFCNDNHKHQIKKNYVFKYKSEEYYFQTNLCVECHNLLNYSLQKLKECPHDIKPKCRKCPSPCYEKPQWKTLAKLMKYSGIKLGYIKIKNKLTELLR